MPVNMALLALTVLLGPAASNVSVYFFTFSKLEYIENRGYHYHLDVLMYNYAFENAVYKSEPISLSEAPMSYVRRVWTVLLELTYEQFLEKQPPKMEASFIGEKLHCRATQDGELVNIRGVNIKITPLVFWVCSETWYNALQSEIACFNGNCIAKGNKLTFSFTKGKKRVFESPKIKEPVSNPSALEMKFFDSNAEIADDVENPGYKKVLNNGGRKGRKYSEPEVMPVTRFWIKNNQGKVSVISSKQSYAPVYRLMTYFRLERFPIGFEVRDNPDFTGKDSFQLDQLITCKMSDPQVDVTPMTLDHYSFFFEVDLKCANSRIII